MTEWQINPCAAKESLIHKHRKNSVILVGFGGCSSELWIVPIQRNLSGPLICRTSFLFGIYPVIFSL